MPIKIAYSARNSARAPFLLLKFCSVPGPSSLKFREGPETFYFCTAAMSLILVETDTIFIQISEKKEHPTNIANANPRVSH